ncbi:MAG: hypothetical protein JOZ41_13935 [Chloroflexi bacterium]|nr:hypothetical protein [Chloroflexota bacterium]
MKVREPITVRFPSTLLDKARGVRAERESLNDLVVAAVEHEVSRREGLRAYDAILRLREEVEAGSGLQPDSTSLIRALRDGSERHT